MTHIRNKLDIQNDIIDEGTIQRRLPNYFISDDEISPLKGFSLSILAHILLILIAFSMQVFVFSKLPKPTPPTRDLEFKLVQNEEKPPINKNTKIRSDRNSRAGGKHDPKRAISDPGRTSPAKKQPKKTPSAPKVSPMKQLQNIVKPQQKPSVQKPTVQKPTQKPVQKPVQTAPQTPSVKKPAPVSAPNIAKPSLKPAARPQTQAPQAPKLATAPKSPFTVPVAPSKAPVGNTYRPQCGSATAGGGRTGSSSGTPAPKFTSSGGGTTSAGGRTGGSGAGSYSTRGSGGGLGSGNNPGPGNPNGTPGIDAIRQPNWGPYMRDLEQRIKRNWFPPKGDSSKRVVITFTIARDGRLLSKKITRSSGVPLADQAALKAIESTAPFRPLPPEFKGTSVPIEFTFDYNVLNSVLR